MDSLERTNSVGKRPALRARAIAEITLVIVLIIAAEVQNCPEQWWHWNLGRYRTVDGRTFGFLAAFEIHDF